MFHVRALPEQATRDLYTAVKRDILSRMKDAGDILQFLASGKVDVHFVAPAGLSKAFNTATDAGALSVLGNSIHLDIRKPVCQLADDLARRTRTIMAAPAPNKIERALHDRAGVTFGRFMKLEQRDGF